MTDRHNWQCLPRSCTPRRISQLFGHRYALLPELGRLWAAKVVEGVFEASASDALTAMTCQRRIAVKMIEANVAFIGVVQRLARRLLLM